MAGRSISSWAMESLVYSAARSRATTTSRLLVVDLCTWRSARALASGPRHRHGHRRGLWQRWWATSARAADGGYTLIGDVVNTATRLNSIAHAGQIILSPHFVDALPQDWRTLGAATKSAGFAEGSKDHYLSTRLSTEVNQGTMVGGRRTKDEGRRTKDTVTGSCLSPCHPLTLSREYHPLGTGIHPHLPAAHIADQRHMPRARQPNRHRCRRGARDDHRHLHLARLDDHLR